MGLRTYIYELFEDAGSLSTQQIITYIVMSVVISVIIYASYYITHEGTVYSKKFNVSLVMLTVLTATVMSVIGNNLALSLGMVGALSIVRYRTAIKDSRDTAYIFWSIVVGICCGVGDFVIAAIGSAIVFLIMLIIGRAKNTGRILLIIKATRNNESQIEGLVFNFFERKARMRVKNTTRDSVEFIFEITQKMLNKSMKGNKSITSELYSIEGVDFVNVVTQNDEISG